MPNNHSCCVCQYWDKQSDESGWCRFDRNPDGKISTKRAFCCGDMYIFHETMAMLETLRGFQNPPIYMTEMTITDQPEEPPKKKRGRPPKIKPVEEKV